MRILLLLLLLLMGCSQNVSDSATSGTTDASFNMTAHFTADSLQAAADSIAKARMLHSLYQGAHVHRPGSDLAEAAHQNPKRTFALKAEMRRQEDRLTKQARSRALAMARKRSETVN